MSVAEDLRGARFTTAELEGHLDVLAERVFQTRTKWPHFSLLLRNLRELAAGLPPGARVVSMERGLLYGGCSLVAPLFQDHDFVSLDCSPQSADTRGAYNAAMVEDPRFLFVPSTHRGAIDQTGLETGAADLLIVPNLVHHVADQDALFAEFARITAPGGKVYVFEPLLRELHQIPDDYLRWTPFGMARAMTGVGLVPGEPETTGGPFEAIAYCWAQALEYFPDDRREEMSRWFYDRHMPELMAWDAAHTENRARQHTAFPVAFSILAEKPA
ncbi:MAG: methyltransferase domain-containing protein [Alphaproteobacteria bacterium]|nr:methyltransferase domain-containing protein [Alphaproteobacteria bacterium]